MTVLVMILAGSAALGVALAWLAPALIPLGYEDNQGFHYGAPKSRWEPGVVSRRPKRRQRVVLAPA